MTQSRTHWVGQIQHPNGRPENVEFIAKKRPDLTDAEVKAGIGWVDSRYPPGDVRRYGAVGDGAADDTTAIQNAIDIRQPVFVPAGTYLVTALDYGTPSFANQPNIIGEGRTKTFITTTGAGPILQFGSTSMTNFISNVLIQGITFEGAGSSITTHGILSYGMVESTIRDCTFIDCTTGYYDYGGIANVYENSKFGSSGSGNTIGLRFNNDATLFYTGDSNANIVRNCQMKANSQWGVYFDYGRQLTVDSCDIESNGNTALGSDYGGIYVGSEAGARVTDYETALTCINCWFEGQVGKAEIWLNGGTNAIKDCYFRTSASNITNDIVIDRGQYQIQNCVSNISKTVNINETSSANVQEGNVILGGSFGNITYDAEKTTVIAERSERYNLANETTIKSGDSGATAPSDADQLVVESAGRTGITILSGNTDEGRLIFGDDGSGFVGWIEYDHNNDTMSFRVNAATRLQITDAPIFPSYSDGTRPAAGVAGKVIFNTTDGQLNVDDGTNWTLPDGTTT